MKIYNAIVKDRHADTVAYPFSDRDTAIRWARQTAKEHARDEDDYEECKIADWEFYVAYSCEGDCIYVIEYEVNATTKERKGF